MEGVLSELPMHEVTFIRRITAYSDAGLVAQMRWTWNVGKHTHGYLNICDVQHKDPECLAPSQEVGSGFKPPGPQASSRCKVIGESGEAGDPFTPKDQGWAKGQTSVKCWVNMYYQCSVSVIVHWMGREPFSPKNIPSHLMVVECQTHFTSQATCRQHSPLCLCKCL